jgi:signal transduction histidine kinase
MSDPTAANPMSRPAEPVAADRLARLLAVLEQALGHDLPNQLFAIQGLARLLDLEEGARLSADGRHYLERVVAAAARAHALIATLAEVTHVTHAPPAAEDVDLAEVAAEAVAEAKQLADDRPAEYHGPEQRLVLAVPRAILRRVLVLLLRRPGVQLSVRRRDHVAELRVVPAGAALPVTMSDPFLFAGSHGLDLFLVAQLAESWGGSVHVESGTTLVVTCPLAAAGDEDR